MYPILILARLLALLAEVLFFVYGFLQSLHTKMRTGPWNRPLLTSPTSLHIAHSLLSHLRM